MKEKLEDIKSIVVVVSVFAGLLFAVDQISAMRSRAKYKEAMEISNAAFAQSQKEAADKKESDRKQRLATVMTQVIAGSEARIAATHREVGFIPAPPVPRVAASSLPAATLPSRSLPAPAVFPQPYMPERRVSPAPAIPQDLEIEERGAFWFGSDGSSGHIRVRPGGGKVYER
jgi:hypothetical protein